VAVVNEAYPWEGSAPQVPILRHRLRDYHTSSEWWSLMSARLQEGFRFLSLSAGDVVDGSADFTVSFWLAWLPNVKMVYVISSSVDVGQPNSPMQRPSSVQLYVYAHCEFLIRLSTTAAQAAVSKKQQRRNPGIEAALKFVKRITRTDKVLNHVSVNASAILSTCDPATRQLPKVSLFPCAVFFIGIFFCSSRCFGASLRLSTGARGSVLADCVVAGKQPLAAVVPAAASAVPISPGPR
jgi:hypothetical protein